MAARHLARCGSALTVDELHRALAAAHPWVARGELCEALHRHPAFHRLPHGPYTLGRPQVHTTGSPVGEPVDGDVREVQR